MRPRHNSGRTQFRHICSSGAPHSRAKHFFDGILHRSALDLLHSASQNDWGDAGMRKNSSGLLRKWLKDTAVGAAVFLLLPLLAAGISLQSKKLSFDDAFAAEIFATRAVEVTSPPSPATENAIIALAQLPSSAITPHARRNQEFIILALTFSLLMGLNLAFWRHLRRVNTATRRPNSRRNMWRNAE